jgi:hypothetical protein
MQIYKLLVGNTTNSRFQAINRGESTRCYHRFSHRIFKNDYFPAEDREHILGVQVKLKTGNLNKPIFDVIEITNIVFRASVFNSAVD